MEDLRGRSDRDSDRPFVESKDKPFTAEDIRFTDQRRCVVRHVVGVARERQGDHQITGHRFAGTTPAKLKRSRCSVHRTRSTSNALTRVSSSRSPEVKPCDHAYVLKIE